MSESGSVQVSVSFPVVRRYLVLKLKQKPKEKNLKL